MATSQTPGVYIEEIIKLPSSIASVETAIPVFIGYTEKAQLQQPGDLLHTPKKISSIIEYEQYFGLSFPETGITVFVDTTVPADIQTTAAIKKPSPYTMHPALQLFFANGGGPCYIVSVGSYSTSPVVKAADLKKGLNAIAAINEVTLILFPDSIHVKTASAYYGIHKAAMLQCAEKKDRFTIMDVWMNTNTTFNNIAALRNYNFGTPDGLSYAAAYYPQLYTRLLYRYNDASVAIKAKGDMSLTGTLARLATINNTVYLSAKNAISDLLLLMPASAAAAGIYAQVDNARGVWKSPANINIALAEKPALTIADSEQDGLNIDVDTGKSINAIRSFAGRGPAIIWGARTLAGNDNEWRYISVRRFFMMVEASVKQATAQFVFEPNDTNTWLRIKAMVDDFCTQQWNAGALMGTTTNNAFFVHVGLGETMTAQDILEGRMIIEIGMAVLRPAEFIIVRFMHKMLQK